MKQSRIAAILAGTVLLSFAGVGTAQAVTTEVTLDVDGAPRQIRTLSDTVADVLSDHNIKVTKSDQVTPAPSTPVEHGQVISVRYQKSFVAIIDGTRHEINTTAATVDEALAQLGIHDPYMDLSVPRETVIDRDGMQVVGTTSKHYSLKVDGASINSYSTVATVGDLLAQRGIEYSDADIITPSADTALSDDISITLQRVVTEQVTVSDAVVPYTSVKTNTADLDYGVTKVTQAGKNGTSTQVWLVTSVDGVETGREMVSEVIQTQPVTEQVLVGTTRAAAPAATGGAIDLSRADMWDRIARCESSGNWAINTGNGYYGGLQFNLQTWRGAGGTDFAAYPHQASREQQITVANRLYASRGLQPWGCRHAA